MNRFFPSVLMVMFVLVSPIFSEDSAEPKTKQEAPTPKSEMPPLTDQDFPVTESPPSYENAFMKMILILVGLLLIIFLSIWLLKRFSRSRITSMNHLRNIKILERRPLSPKTMLYLIDIGGKQIVISESHLEVRKVTSIDWTHDIPK